MKEKMGQFRRAGRKGVSSFMFLAGCMALLLTACGTSEKAKEENRFFTSGSREADQRASQRMAKEDQLAGKDDEKAEGKKEGDPAAIVPKKETLYERLGGEQGITAIVDDFTIRALEDPRVNWARKGVESGGLLSVFRKNEPNAVMWQATGDNVAQLKTHMIQFFSLATGGPPKYEGKEIKQTHAGMQITNAEFDAAIGDLKASLDRLQIADREQKELLAIVESTRPQIVTNR